MLKVIGKIRKGMAWGMHNVRMWATLDVQRKWVSTSASKPANFIYFWATSATRQAFSIKLLPQDYAVTVVIWKIARASNLQESTGHAERDIKGFPHQHACRI